MDDDFKAKYGWAHSQWPIRLSTVLTNSRFPQYHPPDTQMAHPAESTDANVRFENLMDYLHTQDLRKLLHFLKLIALLGEMKGDQRLRGERDVVDLMEDDEIYQENPDPDRFGRCLMYAFYISVDPVMMNYYTKDLNRPNIRTLAVLPNQFVFDDELRRCLFDHLLQSNKCDRRWTEKRLKKVADSLRR
jgi:hypothetical protein